MKTRAISSVLMLGAIAVLSAGSSAADVTVTVNISGTIDEIMPILQYLRNLGVGGPAAIEEEPGPIRLEMHSVVTAPPEEVEAPAPEPEAPMPEPEPTLGLANPVLVPDALKRGAEALVTVNVTDPDDVVDTVVLSLGEEAIDLYDNGSHGDTAPGDGTWSCTMTVPVNLRPGDTALTITAFDAMADPVAVEKDDGTIEPLAIRIGVTVE
ncbi:MAG TPA: hypothetical protein HPP83_05350 [Candidatus Hydrogenedentes bacterium]|nr:hypothetical protein [Candidatus Hydrogenedentota bacterium]